MKENYKNIMYFLSTYVQSQYNSYSKGAQTAIIAGSSFNNKEHVFILSSTPWKVSLLLYG